MPIDPELKDIIDAKNKRPPPWEVPVEKLREAFDEMFEGEGPELPSVEDIDGKGRVYRPQEKGTRPLTVFFHGGGYVKGSVDAYDAFCRRLAKATDSVVFSARYRLAPEHTYPAAHNDAYDALVWAAANTKALKADKKRIRVAGDSAGGDLAACAAIRARDEKGPKIAHQILIYPGLDMSLSFPSTHMPNDEVLTNREDLEWYVDTYYGLDNDLKDPAVSPVWTPDLSKLPSTIIVTAEFDSLRDAAEEYAAKLKATGIQVTCKRYTGMIHGFVMLPDLVSQADQALEDIARFLER